MKAIEADRKHENWKQKVKLKGSDFKGRNVEVDKVAYLEYSPPNQ